LHLGQNKCEGAEEGKVFRCFKVPQCVDWSKRHDGYRDCYDGTDEAGQGT